MGASDAQNPHLICRGYDQKLISTTASCLLYMLSESSLSQMMRDKDLAESYKTEPTKANHDALIQSIRRIKSPLHSENRIDFAHGIFVVLETVFDGVWQSLKFSDPSLANDQAVKEKTFKLWAQSLARILEDMAGGIHGKGEKATEDVIKKWEDETGGSATDLRSDN